MGIADIQQRRNEERKREKRLVHLTNELSRDFTKWASSKSKLPGAKTNAEFIAKSFLDYVFFHDHKEIREINEDHVRDFMLEFAPRRMKLESGVLKDLPPILADFFRFLDQEGHIRNGGRLSAAVDKNAKDFVIAFPKAKKTATAKPAPEKTARAKKSQKETSQPKTGRNDPCPCGSGKKYKKCCGK